MKGVIIYILGEYIIKNMNRFDYIARSLNKSKNNRYESYVVNAIYQKINNKELEIVTQETIKLQNGYCPKIDLYLPQLKIAIEVDEAYHNNKTQKEHDIWRENAIIKKINEYCIADTIQFIRIKATSDSTLEEVNSRIDEVVQEIKKRIPSDLHWKTNEEIRKEIEKNGEINANDCCKTNCDAINLVYGMHYKNWQQAGYKNLWFPVISDSLKDENCEKLTSRASWQNWFNGNKNIIYERSIDKTKNEDKKQKAINDFSSIRVVFAKDRDSFGKRIQRFVGVFQSNGWDEFYNAQIWKLITTKIKIPLTDEYIEQIKKL